MAIRFKEVGTAAAISAAYGGLVTWGEWMDAKRIAATTNPLKNKEFYKKFGFYAYAVPGVAATIISLMDSSKVSKYHKYTDILSIGFFYDAPRFVKNMLWNQKNPAPSASMNAGANAAAIAEANAIVTARRRQASMHASMNAGADTYLPITKTMPNDGAIMPTVAYQDMVTTTG